MIDKLIISYKNLEKINLPLSIGIVGESASGKSTITEDFTSVLSKYYSVIQISTDDYYYDNSKAVKEAGSFANWAKDKDLDSPQAMELSLLKNHIFQLKSGKSVWLPRYDMSGTAIRHDKAVFATPSDIIITEGLFSMCIKDVFDLTIYIDIDKHVQKERWYKRAKERNLGDAMDIMYQRANEKADIYIRPYRNLCDIIISGEGPRPRYKELMKKVLNFLLKQKKENNHGFTQIVSCN
jgi:uridine kinase